MNRGYRGCSTPDNWRFYMRKFIYFSAAVLCATVFVSCASDTEKENLFASEQVQVTDKPAADKPQEPAVAADVEPAGEKQQKKKEKAADNTSERVVEDNHPDDPVVDFFMTMWGGVTATRHFIKGLMPGWWYNHRTK